jgi:hypothetical protein
MRRADFPHFSGLAARSAVGEREQGDVAGALDRNRHGALVPRAGAELSSGLDLAALANVAAKAGDILVVHVVDIVRAELADLPAARETAPATPATATATGARSAALATFTLALRATEAGAWSAISALACVPGIRSRIIRRVVSISHW